MKKKPDQLHQYITQQRMNKPPNNLIYILCLNDWVKWVWLIFNMFGSPAKGEAYIIVAAGMYGWVDPSHRCCKLSWSVNTTA